MQSRLQSLIEAWVGTAIGFALSLCLSAVVFPMFGHTFTLAQNFWITCIFTVASIARLHRGTPRVQRASSPEQEMMTEQWKDVPGYEGRYQASTFGNVRSVPHRVRIFGGNTRLSPGKVLRPGISASGHVSVALGKNNSKMVHAIVMQTFVGPAPEGMEVAHRNGIPNDNRLKNLKYVTYAENIKHVMYHGGRKVSEDQILYLKELNKCDCNTIKQAASEIGISFSHAYAIARGTGKSYAHVH